MTNPRAIRYRRLALAEPDALKADVLRSIADEAERGVLVTSDLRRPARAKASAPTLPPLDVPITVKAGNS
jgi:hypothetical protein